MAMLRWFLRVVVFTLFWLAVVLWFCVSTGCAPRAVGCHPGEHRCQTDSECEDEEAYFLAVEERGQR
jgi:hypothetical protein